MKPAPSATKKKAGLGAPQQVRIIGGRWKRSVLPVLDRPGLRPTPSRVRETLFNWLASRWGPDLPGCLCVDAFAGTGALGLEAASRGAPEVLLVEQDARLVESLRAVVARLKGTAVRVERGDGLQALARLRAGSASIVFLDPPFGADLFLPALQAAQRALAPGGCVYLEAPRAFSPDELAPLGWVLLRHMAAGAVHAHLLAASPAAGPSMVQSRGSADLPVPPDTPLP